MAKICRFTDGISISITGRGFRLVGDGGDGLRAYEEFTMHEAPVTDLVNVGDGRVHALLSSGSIYAIDEDPHSGFVVRKLAA